MEASGSGFATLQRGPEEAKAVFITGQPSVGKSKLLELLERHGSTFELDLDSDFFYCTDTYGNRIPYPRPEDLKNRTFIWGRDGIGFYDTDAVKKFIVRNLQGKPIFIVGATAKNVLDPSWTGLFSLCICLHASPEVREGRIKKRMQEDPSRHLSQTAINNFKARVVNIRSIEDAGYIIINTNPPKTIQEIYNEVLRACRIPEIRNNRRIKI